MHAFRHAARLAAALAFAALAAPASAATLTLDVPNCAAFTMSGSTITCTQPLQTCTVNANPVSPQGNTTATLAVACSPAARAVTWQASRECTAPSVVAGNPLAASVLERGGRSCVYTATADGGGMTSTTVVWQSAGTAPPPPPANAPTGCSIARTPASGSLGASGGAVSMSASCSGGGAVTSWSWRRNATSGWSGAQAPTDNLPGNTAAASVTYTYGVTACAGSACANEVTTTFTVAGSQLSGLCSGLSVQFIDLVWGGYADTSGSATVAPGTVLVGRLQVPANASSPLDSPGVVSIVEHAGPTAERVMNISPQACDFRDFVPGASPVFPPLDPAGAARPMAWSGGINPGIQFLLDGDPAGAFPVKPLLTRGGTYYVNMKTIRSSDGNDSCNSSSCDVRITVGTPR